MRLSANLQRDHFWTVCCPPLASALPPVSAVIGQKCQDVVMTRVWLVTSSTGTFVGAFRAYPQPTSIGVTHETSMVSEVGYCGGVACLFRWHGRCAATK